MALATTALSDLLPLVIPHVKGCPNPLAVQELRMAAIEFCERTKAWREEFTVAFDEQNETIAPLAHAEIHEIETADFADDAGLSYPLTPVAYLRSTPPDRDTTNESQPFYITQASPDTITLVPFSAGTVTLQAIMKPQSLPKYGVSGATTLQAVQNVIPAFIAAKYGEVLAHGALARLFAMPGVPWTQPSLAGARYAQFSAACDRNANRNVTGQQRARLRSSPSWV